MPFYYFDVLHDGHNVTRDHKGVDLPDLKAARAHALGVWRRIIEERSAGGRDPTHWRVAILDRHAAVLALVPYPTDSDALG
jgi:hypothetical protein